MKLNQALTETMEQLITTAKDTSGEWIKFALENPLTQEVKSRYPESFKKGADFVDEQAKQLKGILKMTGMPGFTEKKQRQSETESNAN